jgi:hypothetical protein
MTLQAEVVVSLHQEFGLDGSVGIVAFGTSFPHRFMLEDKCTCLFLMTGGTGSMQ